MHSSIFRLIRFVELYYGNNTRTVDACLMLGSLLAMPLAARGHSPIPMVEVSGDDDGMVNDG